MTELGRWTGRDSIEEETGGLNLYNFCLNSNINNYDILGNASAPREWYPSPRENQDVWLDTTHLMYGKPTWFTDEPSDQRIRKDLPCCEDNYTVTEVKLTITKSGKVSNPAFEVSSFINNAYDKKIMWETCHAFRNEDGVETSGAYPGQKSSSDQFNPVRMLRGGIIVTAIISFWACDGYVYAKLAKDAVPGKWKRYSRHYFN